MFLCSITMNINSRLTGSKSFFLFLVVTYGATEAVVFARCHRSMKKSEPAHSLQLIIITENKKVPGKCSCVAGAGFCHHFIGLLFYLAHLKQLGFNIHYQ